MLIVPQPPARRFEVNIEQFECELPPDVRTELSELHSGQLPWAAKRRSRPTASTAHPWVIAITALVLLGVIVLVVAWVSPKLASQPAPKVTSAAIEQPILPPKAEQSSVPSGPNSTPLAVDLSTPNLFGQRAKSAAS
jgi:hypothetical protein